MLQFTPDTLPLIGTDSSLTGTLPWDNASGITNNIVNDDASSTTHQTGTASVFDNAVLLWSGSAPIGINQAYPPSNAWSNKNFQGYKLRSYSGMVNGINWGLGTIPVSYVNSTGFGLAISGYCTGLTPPFNEITDYLVGTNFGFNIPQTATILYLVGGAVCEQIPVGFGNTIETLAVQFLQVTIFYTDDKTMQGVQYVRSVKQITF